MGMAAYASLCLLFFGYKKGYEVLGGYWIKKLKTNHCIVFPFFYLSLCRNPCTFYQTPEGVKFTGSFSANIEIVSPPWTTPVNSGINTIDGNAYVGGHWSNNHPTIFFMNIVSENTIRVYCNTLVVGCWRKRTCGYVDSSSIVEQEIEGANGIEDKLYRNK